MMQISTVFNIGSKSTPDRTNIANDTNMECHPQPVIMSRLFDHDKLLEISTVFHIGSK